jgi:hypothetical protein
MTPLEKARRRFHIPFDALAMAGGVTSRATRYHCAGVVVPSALVAIGYSVYLQAANGAAGHPLRPEALSVEALILPLQYRRSHGVARVLGGPSRG